MTVNSVSKIVWGSTSSCDTKYWANANGCNGIAAPWGLGPVTQFVAGSKGSVRAWHFLADSGADITKAWSIEKNNSLQVLYYEFIDRSQGATAASTAYANTDTIRWAVVTKAVTGATATFASAAALVAGVVCTLF